jgi:cytoskeletal protein RodZ
MQTIGERLEEARKKKGISIREAAEATKIRGDYLSRFENNQFDINLTELYVRGFLRTYAQFLRLPADRILNDYAALGRGETRRQPSREVYGRMDVSIASADERSEVPAAVADEPAPAAPPPRQTPHLPRRGSSAAPRQSVSIDPALVFKIGKWVGVVVVAVLLVWGATALFKSSPAPATRPAAAATTASPLSTEPTITLIALDTVRVQVATVADNRVLLPETTLARGQTQIVAKPGPIYVTYSDAANLEIEAGGKRYPAPAGWHRVQVK